MSDNWDDDDDDDDSGIDPLDPLSGQGKESEKTVAPLQPPISSRPSEETMDYCGGSETPSVDAAHSDTVPPKTTKDQKGPASSRSKPTNADANQPPSKSRPPSTGNPPPGSRPPSNSPQSSNGRGFEPGGPSVEQDAAELTPRDLDTVREELIRIGIVTEAQWEEAAWAAENEVGDRLRAILAHLQHMPSDPHRGDSDPVLTETQAARIYESPLQYGKYVVVKRLGKGGMGVTYLARRNDGIDQKVVLKVLRLTDRTTPGETLNRRIDQMVSEAKKLIKASEGDSSYFPYFIDFIKDPVEPSMVMEFVQGVTLDEYAADGDGPKLGIEECFDLLIQIAEAFEIPHNLEPPLMHLDIKPTNIMVRPNGAPVILDFGIARFNYDQGQKAEKKRPQTDFQTKYNDLLGPRVGTPPYMPKEQWDGNPEPRSDIYALGATFYFVLTGKLAFPGTTQFEFIHKHGFAERPKPSIERPEVPAELERVVLKMMAIEADDRYQTMTETVEALREAKKLWQARIARKKRNRGLAISGSIAALVAAAVAMAIAMNPDKVQSVLEWSGLLSPVQPQEKIFVDELRDLRDQKKPNEILERTFPLSKIFQAPKQTAAQQAECLAIRWDAKLPIDAETTSPPAQATVQRFEEVEKEITDSAVQAVKNENSVKEYRRKFYLAFSELYERDPGARSKFDERERILKAAAEAGVETATTHPKMAGLYLERAAASDDPSQALIWLGRIDGKLRPSLSDDAIRKIDAELFKAHLNLGHQLVSKQEPTASDLVECGKHLDYALKEWPQFAGVQEKYSEQATSVARARLSDRIASRLDGSPSEDDKKLFLDNKFTSAIDLRLDALDRLLMAYGLTKVDEPLEPNTNIKLTSPQFDELSKFYSRRLDDLLDDKQGQLDAAIALFREGREKLKSGGPFVYPQEAELAKRVADRSIQRLREAEGGSEGAIEKVVADAKALRELFPETCSPHELPDALLGVAKIIEIRRMQRPWSAAKEEWAKAYQLLRDAQDDQAKVGDGNANPIRFDRDPWKNFGFDWASYLLDAASNASSSRPLLEPNIPPDFETLARDKLDLFEHYANEAKKKELAKFQDLLKFATKSKEVDAEDYLTTLRKEDWSNQPLEGFRADPDLTKEVVTRALLRTLQDKTKALLGVVGGGAQNSAAFEAAIAKLQASREIAKEVDGEVAQIDTAIRFLLGCWAGQDLENASTIEEFKQCQRRIESDSIAVKLADLDKPGRVLKEEELELLTLLACVNLGLGDHEKAIARLNAVKNHHNVLQSLPGSSKWLPVNMGGFKLESRRKALESAIEQLASAQIKQTKVAYQNAIEAIDQVAAGDKAAGLETVQLYCGKRALEIECDVEIGIGASVASYRTLFFERKVNLRDYSDRDQATFDKLFQKDGDAVRSVPTPAATLQSLDAAFVDVMKYRDRVSRLCQDNEQWMAVADTVTSYWVDIAKAASLQMQYYSAISVCLDINCAPASYGFERQRKNDIERIGTIVGRLSKLTENPEPVDMAIRAAVLEPRSSPFKIACANCGVLIFDYVYNRIKSIPIRELEPLLKCAKFCVDYGNQVTADEHVLVPMVNGVRTKVTAETVINSLPKQVAELEAKIAEKP